MRTHCIELGCHFDIFQLLDLFKYSPRAYNFDLDITRNSCMNTSQQLRQALVLTENYGSECTNTSSFGQNGRFVQTACLSATSLIINSVIGFAFHICLIVRDAVNTGPDNGFVLSRRHVIA